MAEHTLASRPLAADEAEELRETLKALASPSRLRLLVELLEGERTVEQLAGAAELGPSATSHNLRILRRCASCAPGATAVTFATPCTTIT